MNDPVMQTTQSPETINSQSVEQKSFQQKQISFWAYLAIAIGLALFIRFFIAAPYVVSGASMVPTFYDWHYLIIDKVTYELENPQRGDVIVLKLPQDTNRALIKRIVGLPGDTVVFSGNTVRVVNKEHPDGVTLSEPYVDPANFGGATNMSITLDADNYFVLGDNRRVSADSRVWGLLPRKDIVGRVFLRLYPFNDIGVLPGEARYSSLSATK